MSFVENVMIVDDDPDLREVMTLALELEGYEVEGAENGLVALQVLRHMCSHDSAPSLILLDLSMPVMSGSVFRGAQCRDSDLASIPIVIMSAELDVASRAKSLGVCAYLEKPIEIENLLSTVKRHAKAHVQNMR